MQRKPTRQEAHEAIKLLLEYIGEDVQREGLKNTPSRVIKSYDELFSGYSADLNEIMETTFSEISNYNEAVSLRNIPFSSLCEHHMLPFYGSVDIAYIPDQKVIGISKLARLVDVFAKRLQIQERMSADIGSALQSYLQPLGVAIYISAHHSCMSMRGVNKLHTTLESSFFTGIYNSHPERKKEFIQLVKRD